MTAEDISAATSRVYEAERALNRERQKLTELECAARVESHKLMLARLTDKLMLESAVPTWLTRLTPETGKTLEKSLREALQLGHGHVRPEHLLLALIREEWTADLLAGLSSLSVDEIRTAVIKRWEAAS